MEKQISPLSAWLEEKVIAAMKTVYDPEIPVNIYDLGLIYELIINELSDVYIKMTLTSPNCPVAESIPGEVQQAVRSVGGVNEVVVDLVFEPPWDMANLTEEAKLELGLI